MSVAASSNPVKSVAAIQSCPFSGKPEEFNIWRIRFSAIVKARGWGAILAPSGSSSSSSSSSTAPGTSSSEDAASKKPPLPVHDPHAQGIVWAALLTSIPDGLVQAYAENEESEDPARLWASINKHFQSASTANKAHLRDRLASCKMSRQYGYLAYWTEINSIARSLRSMQEVVPESELMYHVLKGLTSDYDMLKVIIQTNKEATLLSMHELLTVQAEQIRLQQEKEDTGAASGEVFFQERSRSKFQPRGGNSSGCFTCGQQGHQAFDCSKNKGKKKCNFCRAID